MKKRMKKTGEISCENQKSEKTHEKRVQIFMRKMKNSKNT